MYFLKYDKAKHTLVFCREDEERFSLCVVDRETQETICCIEGLFIKSLAETMRIELEELTHVPS